MTPLLIYCVELVPRVRLLLNNDQKGKLDLRMRNLGSMKTKKGLQAVLHNTKTFMESQTYTVGAKKFREEDKRLEARDAAHWKAE